MIISIQLKLRGDDLKQGILLLNMGGPNNIDEVELFLRNMFSDKYILPMHLSMRKFIGNIIIKKRLDEAQQNYRQIGGKSPLTDITVSLCKKIESISGVITRPAMRYVPPFASWALREFMEQGVEEIVLFPMYPQHSTTTTLSSVEDVQEQCKLLGYTPSIKTVEPYGISAEYVSIQVDEIVEAIGHNNSNEYELLLSAHGLPVKIINAGDPYAVQVESSVYRIKEELRRRDVIFKNIKLVYQSKVGGGEWLEPNLADVLRKPEHLKVLIYPIAFTVDNSETVFELDIEHREIAQKIGYEDYLVAKCPNDSEEFAKFIAKQVSLA